MTMTSTRKRLTTRRLAEHNGKKDIFEAIRDLDGTYMGRGADRELQIFLPEKWYENERNQPLEDMMVDAEVYAAQSGDFTSYSCHYIRRVEQPEPGWLYGVEYTYPNEFGDDEFEEFDPTTGEFSSRAASEVADEEFDDFGDYHEAFQPQYQRPADFVPEDGVEYGVYRKDSNELRSVTTFDDPGEAQFHLEQFYNPDFFEVRKWEKELMAALEASSYSSHYQGVDPNNIDPTVNDWEERLQRLRERRDPLGLEANTIFASTDNALTLSASILAALENDTFEYEDTKRCQYCNAPNADNEMEGGLYPVWRCDGCVANHQNLLGEENYRLESIGPKKYREIYIGPPTGLESSIILATLDNEDVFDYMGEFLVETVYRNILERANTGRGGLKEGTLALHRKDAFYVLSPEADALELNNLLSHILQPLGLEIVIRTAGDFWVIELISRKGTVASILDPIEDNDPTFEYHNKYALCDRCGVNPVNPDTNDDLVTLANGDDEHWCPECTMDIDNAHLLLGEDGEEWGDPDDDEDLDSDLL